MGKKLAFGQGESKAQSQTKKEVLENKDIKVFVVDDSDFSRQTLAQVLQAEGFSLVGSAKSAQEALPLIKMNPCDVCLIDVVMPEVSGLDLAKLLNENFEAIKVVMMSSLSADGLVIECISNGAADFLQKPFDKADLFKTIRKAVADINNTNYT
jgi:YesN/AraC family two-component response regulator